MAARRHSNHGSDKRASVKENGHFSTGVSGSRRLFIMRHGERCDFAFGRSWVTKCFDDKGKYTQTDLNLPTTVIARENHSDFLKDSPLTEVGKFQARATGDALGREGVNIQHVYSSPSLRCVQTAQNVIDGMGNNAKICIEPTAFEWYGWYKNSMPVWLKPSHLAQSGFSIDVDHKPFVGLKDLHLDETVGEYYDRCHRLAEHILKRHDDDGDILIVAHAGSLDTFTRRLLGKPARNSQEMHNILSSFTYCCLCCIAQDPVTSQWSLVKPPIPPLHDFNWKALQ
ncbi:ubiquitin-associated and SH3 domain-containing protein B [Elysia marginata]|uniref:Ubiquitin-associated and SH3 domain-containing protein B n=1 Tax=Elysia marginata TaxID=1093978 RepID=A0AAV4G6B5_9GAST|nr:ubiquitin-associated and SH3 domain-containing protein B [Elysia marginata]